LVFDDEQRGLGVRVTAGGGKSYVAQYTFAGSKRRVPLGSCSAISLAAAREAVRTILGDAARGVDTAAERKEARLKAAGDGLTLADLIDQWDKLHLSAKRANYSTAATSSLRRSFAIIWISPPGRRSFRCRPRPRRATPHVRSATPSQASK
jgi:Arm DNA-binding domain